MVMTQVCSSELLTQSCKTNYMIFLFFITANFKNSYIYVISKHLVELCIWENIMEKQPHKLSCCHVN